MTTQQGTTGRPPGSAAPESDHETEKQRLTRNYNELLQELRVTQTGVQILTGFLLTVPFTQRFADLTTLQKNVYLGVLSGAILATGLIIAPVAFHRTLFRQGERPWLVHASNWCARAGLFMLGLTLCGVVWLVFDIVIGHLAATLAGLLAVGFFVGLWALLPLAKRTNGRRAP